MGFRSNHRGGGIRFGGRPVRGNFKPNRIGRGGGGRGRGQLSSFDHSHFVNKAVPQEPEAPYVPIHRFEELPVADFLKRNITGKGYREMTPIQDQAILPVLEGRDVVGIANTGTGKTAAFLIPLLQKVTMNRGERVLIMVPTRELAVQIASEFKSLTRDLRLYAAVCVGGVGINPQIAELRRNPQFVIGTPGRLKDLIERRVLNLSFFKTVVLDEADRMLDMGFIPDMRHILGFMPRERQTLLFSATLSREIEALIFDFVREPVHIKVSKRETAAGIEQDIVRIPPGRDKLSVLHDLLRQPGFDKVLVFGRTKYGVEKLAKKLVQMGVRAESIHGNKTHNHRQRALSLFKEDHVQVLVATDVAARGLDINGVSHVINFDLPNTNDDYVHRIGRTGRAGKCGKALTFID